MLDALVFDVDGTLAETEEVHRAAFNATFAEAGLGWSWDQPLYGELLKVTGGKERIRHYMEAMLRQTVTADAETMIATLHRHKTRLYGEMIGEGRVALRPGVGELIAAARRAGVRLAIATTTSRPNVEALLDATLGAGARTTFEVIVAGDEVAAKKPAPDVYVEAVRLLEVPAARSLALEDSWNGVRSALGAGLPVLVTKGIYTQRDRFDGAIAVVETLYDLLPTKEQRTEPGAELLDAVRRVHAAAPMHQNARVSSGR